MDSDIENYELDSAVCPCEFCEQLFPFELLMEHQSACRPDLLHYSPEDQPLNNPLEQNIIQRSNNELLQFEKSTRKTTTDSVNVVEKEKPSIAVSNMQKRINQLTEAVIKPDVKTEKLQPLRSSDDQLQNNEVKIMAFGTKKTKEKIANAEKLTFKKPSLPLLNYVNNGPKDSCCNIGDDDSESLEEFWRRADIALKQRKNKIMKNINM